MTTRLLGLASLALVLGACPRAPRETPAPAAPAPPPAEVAPPPAATTVAPREEDLVEETPEANPTSETVTIKLSAEASRKARVFWGRKDLGLAPLELQRPRGSGPMDLLVLAPGALPLHTRVYTDRDDKLSLRFYSEGEAPGMLGYRADEAAKLAAKPAAKSMQKSGSVAVAAPKKRPPRGP